MPRPIAALLALTALTSLAGAPLARAEDAQQQKIDDLTKKVEALEQRVKKDEDKSLSHWLTIGGDYRFRIDSLGGSVPNYYQYTGPTSMPVAAPGFDPKNDTLMTNRFGLNLKAKATQDVSISARLLMYKVFGMETSAPVNAGFFADRMQTLDGTIGHVPIDNTLRVDQVYATWNNIGGQPIWFSVGRRPSTGGSPTHVRQNGDRPGNGGVPGLLVDYAFDGMTLGVAPEIDALPGAFGKICYGRGFEAGYGSGSNSLNDTEMLGFQLVPVDTDPLRIDFQYNRGFNIFDNPNAVGNQLGDMDWIGVGLLSTLKKVGPGNLTSFASGGLSMTHPNGNHALLAGAGSPDSGAGLLVNGPDTSGHTGWSVYAGLRYDLPTGTKIGAEYNHGSEFWMPFDPAADDMWTSKLGTRGNVYEAYLIQELPLQPISSFNAKTFVRLGYQYYDFTYTGSNNWVGAPVKISDLAASPMNAQMFAPLKSAHDIYATFEVKL
ncbi:DUF3373 domain-containing protein [Anaeromyxobacter paludicola]|uniref:DUF3373 domain-containing protein n=1 Tax=Anaeromyxobacter paludicola TaxID=2918171 RepID=A0ABN6N7M0_9BACT|nr:DUF3373 domain-containing protein [Anaeromyxobacter paludicola]BDG09170.1 hypothetical protein AMPC_22830 [Anaeromyxobacter paludicola]